MVVVCLCRAASAVVITYKALGEVIVLYIVSVTMYILLKCRVNKSLVVACLRVTHNNVYIKLWIGIMYIFVESIFIPYTVRLRGQQLL